MSGKNKNSGFTLIELMIVTAIVGILAAIAYPSYQRQVLRSHRTEGLAALQQTAARQERFYSNNSQYAPNIATLGVSATTENGYYNLSINAVGPCGNNTRCYTLTADATTVGGQNNDAGCTSLTLDSTGVKGPPNCW